MGRLRDPLLWLDVLQLEQAVADTRSMARTVGRAEWEPRFRTAWVALLGRAADAVRDADPDRVRRTWEELDSLAEQPSHAVEAALVVNLRNVLEAMAPVAAAQPVRVRR